MNPIPSSGPTRGRVAFVSFDPQTLRSLGGRATPTRPPVAAAFLLRVGISAGVAAALCDVVLLLIARGAGWDTSVDGQSIEPLPVVLVSVLVGLLAAVATYVAARVTKRPSLWVALAGAGLWLASIQDLPPAIVALHTVTAVWVVGWLTFAVRGGSHL
jgi:hypothetical protein